MPGAGKTTAAYALTALGLPVLGEYTDDADATIAVSQHPAVADDDAHQHNWLRKAAWCTARLAGGDAVYADRDWLSSLSYAYSPLKTLHRSPGIPVTARLGPRPGRHAKQTYF